MAENNWIKYWKKAGRKKGWINGIYYCDIHEPHDAKKCLKKAEKLKDKK